LAALATGQAAGVAARGGVVANEDLRGGKCWGALARAAILAGIGARFEGSLVARVEQGRTDLAAAFAAGGRCGRRGPTFRQGQGQQRAAQAPAQQLQAFASGELVGQLLGPFIEGALDGACFFWWGFHGLSSG